MAEGRIKGLTVTIDGDATRPSKGLKNVNKKIKDARYGVILQKPYKPTIIIIVFFQQKR